MKKPDTTKRLEDALSEANPEEREALRAMWHHAANADEAPNISADQVDELWQHLATQAEKQTPPSVSRPFNRDRSAIERQKRPPQIRRWAASVVALIIVALGVVWWLQPLVRTAPHGERLAVQLPDGSSIELNSGSSIKYPRFFAGSRDVSLEGEAFFDVVESSVPFTVQTFNAKVQVLGTTFNVSAWSDASLAESKVTLASGSIRLTSMINPGASIEMMPGQTAIVRDGTNNFVQDEPENIDYIFAWRKGELVFKDQRLEAILEEAERRFGIDIELRANRLADKQVTFSYRRVTSTENFVEDLCHALNLRYRPISNGYELFEE